MLCYYRYINDDYYDNVLVASAIEAMGLTLPYSSSIPAEDPQKLNECIEAGQAMRNLLELDLKPRDIVTRESFENAMVLTIALGGKKEIKIFIWNAIDRYVLLTCDVLGSTNAVLHLIAIARAFGIKLGLDDFQAVSDRIPFIADLKPRYVIIRKN
jgi:dihydroxy-acid dehydratase